MNAPKPDSELTYVDFEEPAVEPEVRWRETLRVFCSNRAALLGLVIVSAFVLVGIFGPVFYPADPFEPVAFPLSGPGEHTLLGTDYLGRDVALGILYGTRPTLIIAAVATLVTVLIGITLGAVAALLYASTPWVLHVSTSGEVTAPSDVVGSGAESRVDWRT